MSYLLFADDNEDMRLMLRDLFHSSGHEVCLAEDGLAALASIREREPDLVILDHSMPGMSGFEVCRNVKRNPFTSRIPVLMLTAQSEIESKIEGFAAGADDYLAKPFDPRELRARVSALLRLVEREGDRNPTSGLPGGHAIEKEIARRVAKADAFSVCYLDLDNFKAFADTFGFATADIVIRGLGAAIRDSAYAVAGEGGGDFVGHIGGDDFAIVCHPDAAHSVADGIVRTFDEQVTHLYDDEDRERGYIEKEDRAGIVQRYPMLTLSIGIASTEIRPIATAPEAASIAVEMKRFAKGVTGSTWAMDRRKV